LTVRDNTFFNGQNVWLWKCDGDGSIGQKFSLDDNPGLLRVAAAPNYCVVIDGNQNRDGANIQLWTCDDSTLSQHWNHYPNGVLFNAAYGPYVDIVVDNNQGYNGNNIQLGWVHPRRGDGGLKWWHAQNDRAICASEGQSCGWNNAKTLDCCDEMECTQGEICVRGKCDMQCVKKA